jgi:hypothetical protein
MGSKRAIDAVIIGAVVALALFLTLAGLGIR